MKYVLLGMHAVTEKMELSVLNRQSINLDKVQKAHTLFPPLVSSDQTAGVAELNATISRKIDPEKGGRMSWSYGKTIWTNNFFCAKPLLYHCLAVGE